MTVTKSLLLALIFAAIMVEFREDPYLNMNYHLIFTDPCKPNRGIIRYEFDGIYWASHTRRRKCDS